MKGFRRRRAAVILALAAVIALLSISPPASGQASSPLVIWFLGFNTTLPPFDNAMARQAVALALDRPKLAAADENTLATGIEPPGCLGYNPSARLHPFNPDRSTELLSQSGINLEEQGDVSVWHFSGLRRGGSRRELELLVGNISAIGFRPTLREFGNYNAFSRIATLSVVKMSYWGILWDTLSCSRETFLEDLAHSKGDLNFFGYRNAEVDSLIDRARATQDRAAKIRLFQEAEQKVLDQAVLVPVWYYVIR